VGPRITTQPLPFYGRIFMYVRFPGNNSSLLAEGHLRPATPTDKRFSIGWTKPRRPDHQRPRPFIRGSPKSQGDLGHRRCVPNRGHERKGRVELFYNTTKHLFQVNRRRVNTWDPIHYHRPQAFRAGASPCGLPSGPACFPLMVVVTCDHEGLGVAQLSLNQRCLLVYTARGKGGPSDPGGRYYIRSTK